MHDERLWPGLLFVYFPFHPMSVLFFHSSPVAIIMEPSLLMPSLFVISFVPCLIKYSTFYDNPFSVFLLCLRLFPEVAFCSLAWVVMKMGLPF